MEIISISGGVYLAQSVQNIVRTINELLRDINRPFFKLDPKCMCNFNTFRFTRISVYTKNNSYCLVSSNPVHDEVYSIQHYILKFVSELRQVGGFPRILRFPPPIKLTATV